MGNDFSDDDLWHEATKHVKKIKIKSEKKTTSIPDRHVMQKAYENEHFFHHQFFSNKNSLEYLALGNMSGLDKCLARSIKQGKCTINRTLDLHGKNRHQAYISFQQCITHAFQQHQRCILVITGKGKKQDSFQHEGVIRHLVPEWVNQESVRPMVVAYCHAAPQHGGTGALYIYLRRQR